jgi:hypothetical protein
MCSLSPVQSLYEQPTFDPYDDDEILILGWILIGNPSDEDAEVFSEEKGISLQPSNESEIFYQEQHDKDKEPSIDIHEVIREDKGEVDQQSASTFHSHVLATDIQPEVSKL